MAGHRPVRVAQSVEDVRSIARILGHDDVVVMPSPGGSRWVVDCACGYVSSGYVRQVEAVASAQYHLAQAVRGARRYAHDHGITLGEALGFLEADQTHLAIVVDLRRRAADDARND